MGERCKSQHAIILNLSCISGNTGSTVVGCDSFTELSTLTVCSDPRLQCSHDEWASGNISEFEPVLLICPETLNCCQTHNPPLGSQAPCGVVTQSFKSETLETPDIQHSRCLVRKPEAREFRWDSVAERLVREKQKQPGNKWLALVWRRGSKGDGCLWVSAFEWDVASFATSNARQGSVKVYFWTCCLGSF